MIQLNKLNGEEFVLNALLIEQIQSLPDTTITFVSGRKMVVRNSLEEVLDKIKKYHQEIGLLGISVKAGGEEYER